MIFINIFITLRECNLALIATIFSNKAIIITIIIIIMDFRPRTTGKNLLI